MTKRILIIEDDQILARIYWKQLIARGYAVEVAPDGLRGVQMVQTYRPDLVVLDLMLPGLNGVQVLESLRQEPATRDLPVILFTNQFMGDLFAAARQSGATKVLNKTDNSPAALANEIAALIGDSVHSPLPPTNIPDAPPPSPAEQFTRQAAATAAELRRLLDAFLIRGSGDLSRLLALLQRVRAVKTLAEAAGFALTAHFARALETLLQALNDDPHAITPSARHTTTKAVQCLAALVTFPEQPTHCDFSSARVVAVDDDLVALRLASHALAQVNLRAETISNPFTAQARLAEKPFDLILLDVEMPQLDGMQLCRHLRQTAANAKTPVIFVTAVDEHDRRETALAHGADDLIAKPFLSAELAVKALTYLLTAR
jgi:CheY-like chemotaxis protein